LADFQFSLNNFQADGVQIIAASSDPIEKAKKLAEDLIIAYPLAYGLDFEDVSRVTGCFYEKERKFSHPLDVVLRPDKTIAVASYSSGAIGRFGAQETLRLIRFWKNQAKK
jgi:peroxiredoxin